MKSFELDRLDFVFQDANSQRYLGRALAELSRTLQYDEVEKIRQNRIFLIITIAPGSTLSNFYFTPSEQRQSVHLVAIDKTISDHCALDTGEMAANILHEFGHALNCPTDGTSAVREFFADSYAKQLGYGAKLVASLRKYLASGLPYIDDEMRNLIHQRIEKLEDDEQEPLVGNPRELRQ